MVIPSIGSQAGYIAAADGRPPQQWLDDDLIIGPFVQAIRTI